MKPSLKANTNVVQKIAMLGSLPPIRGLSSYCLEICMAMAGLMKVEFISFKKMYPAFLYPGGNLNDDPTFPEISHHNVTVKRRMTWYNPFSWLSEGLSTKADLLHAQWWSLPLVGIYACVCLLFKLRHKPVIFTVHNVLCHDRSKLYQLASRVLFSLGDHFIVHTHLNREQMMSIYQIPFSRISVVAHGSLNFQVKRAIDRDTIRMQMAFRPEHRVILFFGAIRPYKGLDTLLRAVPEVLQQNPTARLLIAGKLWEKWSPYATLIDDLAISEYVICHLEYIPAGDVHRYFSAADLVILPYHHFDSQSGVGATAVAFQKPMIVTNVGGLPELVSHQDQIVEPGDPCSLAQAINRYFCNHHSNAATPLTAKSVTDRLQWPSIAQKTHTIYNQVLSARNHLAEEID